MLIRYTEEFLSVQGEGKWVGVPSVFFRTYSCNFRCSGFGMPRGKLSDAVEFIDPDKYDNLEDLPMVDTGCDSYVSWHPNFKKFTKWEETSDVAKTLTALAPSGKWVNDQGQDTHLVLTGGEPMMWQKQLEELLADGSLKDLRNITFETNCTQEFKGTFYQFLSNLASGRISGTPVHITWSCSPKLTISGEKWEDAIRPTVASSYASLANSNLYFKFVVGNDADLVDVRKAVDEYREAGVEAPVYLMPVGATTESQVKTERQIAELCLKHGYRFSPRLHCHLFGNAWAT